MNNLAVVTDDTPLQPGQVRFYCAAQPPLQAGLYCLHAKQSVTGLLEQPTDNTFGLQNPLVVEGPRFRLPPQDLQLVYPPAYQVGNFEESLPHVVLRTRTLPWVRQIDGSSASDNDVNGDNPPWLGLLSFSAAELQGAKPFTTTVGSLINTGAVNILGPSLYDAQSMTQTQKDQQLLAIDLDLQKFLAIAPQLQELPFLAHVREVNTDQKEIMNMVEDGWFSVVVGNRLPTADSDNTCFLVSLEGQQAHLPGGPAIDPVYTKIRLVCLASWTFTAAAARGSFLGLMQDLPARGGVNLLQAPHDGFGENLTAEQQLAKEALEIGYLPLQNLTRSGELTTSWYRGPCCPVPTGVDSLGPYFYSDKAIWYDPSNGLFNMSYASAWQIGQLLALADPAFASALFDWRRQPYQGQQAVQASAHLQTLAKSVGVPELRHSAASAGSTESKEGNKQAAQMLPILQSVLGRLSALLTTDPTEPTEPTEPAMARTADASFSATAATLPKVQAHAWRDAAQLPGVIDENAWQQALANGQDPLAILHQHVYQNSSTE